VKFLLPYCNIAGKLRKYHKFTADRLNNLNEVAVLLDAEIYGMVAVKNSKKLGQCQVIVLQKLEDISFLQNPS
jgi:hypothetical protein